MATTALNPITPVGAAHRAVCVSFIATAVLDSMTPVGATPGTGFNFIATAMLNPMTPVGVALISGCRRRTLDREGE